MYNDFKAAEPIKKVELKRRQHFLKLLPQKAVCAELGVAKGVFSRNILKICDPKKFYMVDPYWKVYGDTLWNGIETMHYFKGALDRIREHDNWGCATIVIEYDTVFLSDLADNFFDWVYVDTTHTYEDTLKELKLLRRKVKDDGYICGHDYGRSPKHHHFGVTKAVTEWLSDNEDYELYLVDNFSDWIIRMKNA